MRTCALWCREDEGHEGGCRSSSRMQRTAVHRLMRVVGPSAQPYSVAYWDQRTSGNDARAALSIACGANPNDVHPVGGQWTRPATPVQLSFEEAA